MKLRLRHIFMTTITSSQLWYEHPAKDWNEALPIGNGRLGGMIFGSVNQDRIQLNEDSIWNGGPSDRNNPDALTYLPKIRQLLKDGRIAEAEDLARSALTGMPDTQRHYELLGDLFLEVQHSASHDAYRRILDLETAIASVQYQVDNVTYQREYFASAPDQVIVIRLSVDRPGHLNTIVKFRRQGEVRGRVYRKSSYVASIRQIDDNGVLLTGRGGDEQAVQFCGLVKVKAVGGTMTRIGPNLHLEQADEALIVLGAATSFYHKTPFDVVVQQVNAALQTDYNTLKSRHIEDYQRLYQRVSLVFGGEDFSNIPTNQRLQQIAEGTVDLGLVAQYFQFGRYLLISSSRPGTLPANLQGIWNTEWLPPWDSKYTININTEMNYFPAETCNLTECHRPLFDHIERMRTPGRISARKIYDCRGFTAHHNTDIWADTAPQDEYIPATYWTMGAAWLCTHLWEHYLFNLDKEFLARAYPTMKEAAEFFVDFLIEDEQGRLVTCPSVSPENTYILPNGEQGCLCMGPSMDSQILYALFSQCIKASQILQTDEAFRKILQEMRERLPKPSIGKHGQIMEWAEDYEEAEPGHRHISHLWALHPGHQITLDNTPELAQAARVTLERRLAHGGGHTGWSRAWIINFWARLQDGDRAFENIQALLAQSTLPNLLDNHPPFQIDGNFGGTAGIAEMLLQSLPGEIRLLPALPSLWKTGNVIGLRARGAIEVDIEWENAILAKAILKAGQSGEYRLLYQDKETQIQFQKNQTMTVDGELNIIA